MEIFSDASTFKWGGVVHLASGKREIYDYWSKEERGLPIMVLESKALLNVIRSIKGFLKGERVDAGVDNMVLINAWKNEGCRSRELNVVLKDLFAFVLQQDLVLNLVYVTSSQNVADAPSRVLNKSDASLMREVWGKVQGAYGGEESHTVDLMSLDSNCMTDFRGKPLKHFTPFQTPYSAGVNVFSQEIAQSENCYAFPPFNLIGSLISFIVECRSECTVIVPASDITPIWQPNVVSRINDALLIGMKGEKGVLRYPSKKGFIPDRYGLPWNLWAVRLGASGKSLHQHTTYGRLRYLCDRNKGVRMNFIAVGDSMLRFLSVDPFFSCPMVTVIARGGALVQQVNGCLLEALGRDNPGLVLVHAGVNNLSKNYLYRDELHQGQSALEEWENMASNLAKYVEKYPETKIILLSVTATKDGSINAKARILNSFLSQICTTRDWCYMDNSCISRSHLRDTVHFSGEGEKLFIENLKDTIRTLVQ